MKGFWNLLWPVTHSEYTDEFMSKGQKMDVSGLFGGLLYLKVASTDNAGTDGHIKLWLLGVLVDLKREDLRYFHLTPLLQFRDGATGRELRLLHFVRIPLP
jgi:hypothetical protein